MKVFLFLILMGTLSFANDYVISKTRGKIIINDSTSKVGTKIKVNDILSVEGKGSFVQIKSSDGSVMMLKKGKMIFRGINKDETNVHVLGGKFFHYLNPKRENKKSKFSVQTQHATFGIRGTKYFINVDSKESYLCVCDGTVSAKSKSDQKEFSINKHEDLYLSKDQSKKADANKMMFMMGDKAFAQMGVPLE